MCKIAPLSSSFFLACALLFHLLLSGSQSDISMPATDGSVSFDHSSSVCHYCTFAATAASQEKKKAELVDVALSSLLQICCHCSIARSVKIDFFFDFCASHFSFEHRLFFCHDRTESPCFVLQKFFQPNFIRLCTFRSRFCKQTRDLYDRYEQQQHCFPWFRLWVFCISAGAKKADLEGRNRPEKERTSLKDRAL